MSKLRPEAAWMRTTTHFEAAFVHDAVRHLAYSCDMDVFAALLRRRTACDALAGIAPTSARSPQTMMIFEPSAGGHHSDYLRHLLHHFRARESTGRLDLVVSPWIDRLVPDVVALAAASDRVTLHRLHEDELYGSRRERRLRGLPSVLARSVREWRLFCRYARELDVAHGVVMYLDLLLSLPLALGLRAPCKVSGIFFRPRLHYERFAHAPTGSTEALHRLRGHVALRRAIRHPDLGMIFTLDPYLPAYAREVLGTDRVVHLVDPVRVAADVEERSRRLIEKFGLDDGRKRMLLFGVLTARKGVRQVLDAAAMLPRDVAEGVSILLIGWQPPSERSWVDATVARLARDGGPRIVVHAESVPEADVQSWFSLADAVLTPYQHHIGMASIMLRAAAAGVPVIADRYGLLGEMTLRNRLGLVVDASSPAAIAEAMARFSREPNTCLIDTAASRAFASTYTPEAFAEMIFDHARDDVA